MMRKILSTSIAMLVTALPSPSLMALSLSDIELKSALNQILDARVLLLAVDKDELGSLQININDNANLKYEIKENENGHYISITSRDVVKEPVLNFSLEVSWSKGRLIREYSLLIDPRQ